jgi:hypothetical protein
MSVGGAPPDSRLTPEAAWVFVVGALLCALFVAACAYFAWERWQRYQDFLSDAEPRIARLQGLVQSEEAIAEALAAARARVADYAYPESVEPTRAASDLQNRVRDALQGAGVRITDSQQLPGRRVDGLEEISLNLGFLAELPQLESALASLMQLTPYVRIERLRLQPARADGSPSDEASQVLLGQILVVTHRQVSR